MPTPAIADYALLSDCQTAALVSRSGSIDWYCPSRFDAPSIFARLLDDAGGHWSIRPAQVERIERSYLPDTMVVRTVFHTPTGSAALIDALAFASDARGHQIGMRVPHLLLRRVEGLQGSVTCELDFAPRIEYALTTPYVVSAECGVIARGGPLELNLLTQVPLETNTTTATGCFTVATGEVADFALHSRPLYQPGDDAVASVNVGAELENTCSAWRSWGEHHQTYPGPYHDVVRRSAFVLQALTYQPSGTVVAAATTSLPEVAGGSANWDYRFAWLRDLSLTLRALWVAACPDEVLRYFHWIDSAMGHATSAEQHVQIMYGVGGERDLTEHTLDHLHGFAGSQPVRTGNSAWRQKQIDVLGEVVDSIYLFRDYLEDPDDGIKRLVQRLADEAARRWHEPDAGMWEARDRERHYLSSKVMCWVALDRAVKLAPRLGDTPDVDRWRHERDAVRQAILRDGWNEETGAYTGAFGSPNLDASVLLMPLVGFLPADDPRMRATIEVIDRELNRDGLVHRWAGDENGFFLCTYWLVECLARIGELERARSLFERTTAYANDLGLLAEMADPATGAQLGNFPQAFSHVGIINAAWSIHQATQHRRQFEEEMGES